MYSKAELTAKAHIELIDIAEKMGIPKAKRLDVQDLVYKILDHQASNPAASAPAEPADGAQGQRKRQRLKPKLLAESTLKNPELHKSNRRNNDNNRQQQDVKPVELAENPLSSLNFKLSSLEMPTVPEVPDILTPSVRPIFYKTEAEAAPAVQQPQPEAEPQPQPEAAEAPKRKRGRPRKNAQPADGQQPEPQDFGKIRHL